MSSIVTSERESATTAASPGVDDRWVVVAVARAHGRQILRHPLVWLGTVASMVLLVGLPEQATGMPEFARYSTFVGLGSAPLAAATLLAGHHNVSRPWRDGTEALFTSLAAKPSARTAGQLVGAVAAAVPALVVLVAWIGYLTTIGTTGTPDVGELAVAPVVAVLAAVVGTSVATWAPQRFAGFAALGVFAAIQMVLQDLPAGTVHWLAWWRTSLWHTSADLWIRPTGWHLAYLVAIAVAIGGVALLRHGRTTPRLGGVALAVVAVAVAGAAQLPNPTEAEVEAVYDRIANPEKYWDCEQTGRVEVCLFPAYSGWRSELLDTARNTLAPLPDNARQQVTITQHHHRYPSQLMDEFGLAHPMYDTLQARSSELPDSDQTGRTISIDTTRWETTVNEGFGIALATAKRAAGLPLQPLTLREHVDADTYDQLVAAAEKGFVTSDDPSMAADVPDGTPGEVPGSVVLDDGTAIITLTKECRPTGQARAAVAMWLAGQSGPERAGFLASLAQQVTTLSTDSGIETEDGGFVPTPPYLENYLHTQDPALQWPAEAAHLGAQLLDIPDVQEQITGRWDRWTDPATTTDELVAAFDLRPFPTVEEQFRQAGIDPADHPEAVAAWPNRPDDTFLTRTPTCP